MILVYLSLLLAFVCGNTVLYDSFSGLPITKEVFKDHVKKNNSFWCVTEIEKCNPLEGRRIDGSCNNLMHPTRGTAHTPMYRILPADYGKDFEPRQAQSGNDLPLSRFIRTSLLCEGKVPDQSFTQLATHFLTFMAADVVSQHDTINYIEWTPHCCQPKGKTDHNCIPIKVPQYDPVHRFSGISCMNLTRPMSFQSVGCLNNNTVPERIVTSSPLLDLSQIYSQSEALSKKKGRQLFGGLLKTEKENGKIWPPSSKSPINVCRLNQKPHETRCHDGPDDGLNSLGSINLVSIWFWRLHNVIATNLAKVNPCWDDDRLFHTARDINIAIVLQIYIYELLPLLMGKNNLLKDSVMSSNPGFRDLYNQNVVPQMSVENLVALRWFHTMQEGSLKMYDTDGYYLKEIGIVNLTLRSGYFGVGDNIDHMTQGAFRQPSGKLDYVVDPDVAEIGLGPHQLANDITASDLTKNRYFGFQPYVKYLEFCYGRPYEKFEHLSGLFDPERLEMLKSVYEHVKDIDLSAGMWLERYIKGGLVPPTFYCIVVEQLIRNIVSDRFWYEREHRPNAFTLNQLLEIRKASISWVLCTVGDRVSQIQPRSFLRAGPKNRIACCSNIKKIDFSAWEDPTCEHYHQRY